jgi:hypothetical protein
MKYITYIRNLKSPRREAVLALLIYWISALLGADIIWEILYAVGYHYIVNEMQIAFHTICFVIIIFTGRTKEK